jgi:hypothetical protein
MPKVKEPKRTYETCGAKNRKGEPCGKPAGAGTPHVGVGRCRNHGGCSTQPAYIARMHDEMIKMKAERELIKLKFAGFEGGTDNPRLVLLEELRRSTMLVRYLEWRIHTDQLPTGVDRLEALSTSQPVLLQKVTNEFGSSFVEHASWSALRSERIQLVNIAKACHAAGIAEAMIDQSMAVSKDTIGILTLILTKLGLDPFEDTTIAVFREAISEFDGYQMDQQLVTS